MKCATSGGVLLAVVILLSVTFTEAAVPSCFHYWKRPKPAYALPLEPCEEDSDCCGLQECRTYSALPPLGAHKGYPDMTAIGKKRCAPKSWGHASPKPDEMVYAEGADNSIWALNLKPPVGWTCNDGTTKDWYMSRFCCADDWAADIFPPSRNCGQRYCWANDVTEQAYNTCKGIFQGPPTISISDTDACCSTTDDSAIDKYTDTTTQSRCLVGFANLSPAKDSNEAWYGPVLKPCCRSTCRYFRPDSELWLCMPLRDLGWARLRYGKVMRRMMPNACDLKAKRATVKVFNCEDL